MRDLNSPGRLISRFTLITAFIAIALPAAGAASATDAEKGGNSCLLQSRRVVGSIDRVTVKLDAGGELKFVEDKKVGREKMSVVAELEYAERTLAVPKDEVGGDKKADAEHFRSVRYYERAEAVIKVGEGGFKPTLRDERRLIGVENGNLLFSPMGPLARDELDLLEINGDSLLLDRLLPGRAVAQGDSWEQSEDLMTALLGLDSIATCEVKSTLETLSQASALMVMSGRVEGAIGGVSTRKTIKAKYRFDRRTDRIDWFGLLVKEDGDIGHVNTGVELVARVQMQIKPVESSPHLSDVALEGFSLDPSEEMRRLVHRSDAGGWEFSHDRRWFVTVDQRSRSVLRMVDRGELIAQCNITALAKVEPGKQITLAQFQSDIKEALGESFGEFINASQRANDAKCRILRVEVGGESSELPVRWIYYLIADEQGRQVTLTFTVEKTNVERLAGADRAVVETMRFIEQEVAQRDGSVVQ